MLIRWAFSGLSTPFDRPACPARRNAYQAVRCHGACYLRGGKMKTFECLDCGETFEEQSRPDGHHEHACRCGTSLQWDQGQVIGEPHWWARALRRETLRRVPPCTDQRSRKQGRPIRIAPPEKRIALTDIARPLDSRSS